MATTLNSTSQPSKLRHLLRCLPTALAMFAVACAYLVASDSLARVNPLVVIERQLHKGNMLIVLDTSGSMTGVPGGQFANNTEAGVDCDNSANCRNGGVQGLCKWWGRVCTADSDCRTSWCEKNNTTQCSSSEDCPQDPGVCSLPTTTCTLTTSTQTATSTQTHTNTQTATSTQTGTGTQTGTSTQTNSGTRTNTSTKTATNTNTATNTRTGTNTNTTTKTNTATNTATTTSTNTATTTKTSTTTQTGTRTSTGTTTTTQTGTQSQTLTANATVTITGSVTSTNTAYCSDPGNRWNDWYGNCVTDDYWVGTGSANATSTVTATYAGTITKTFVATGVVTGSFSSTETANVLMPPHTTTSTLSWVWPNIVPATVAKTGTATTTVAESWTYPGTGTQSYSNTQTDTTTQTSTKTQTETDTQTTTKTQTGTNTNTATGTETKTGTKTATGTQTATNTQTGTGTQTSTGTNTGTSTQTSSSTQTSTRTQTATGTQTATDSATATQTQTGVAAISCTTTNSECALDRPCPDPGMSCSVTGDLCTDDTSCVPVGKCKYTNLVCPNPGGNCANVNVCAHTTSTTCATAANCPPLPGAGACSRGGTPQGGCTSDRDCPSYKRCSVTNDSCFIDTDCPLQSSGTCSGSGSSCNNTYRRCPSGQTCIFAGQTCVGTNNVCSLPQDTCVAKTDNACTSASNTCTAPTNTCVMPPLNDCLHPIRDDDLCVESPGGKPGPIRMCLIAQTVCRNDSDCTGAGDGCGPATSRAVIAKRAISSIVQNNYKLLNFGLMTFYQNGYFPYYLNTSGNTGVVTVFEALDKLIAARCFSTRTGPTNTCRINGNNMTLRDSPNSRYHVRTSASTWIDADADWDSSSCNMNCDLPGELGMGHFVGAYYQYEARVGGNSTTMSVQPTYSGQNVTFDGKTYSYYQPLTNYYNGGAAPPLDFPNCGSSCSAECGGRWDTQLAPFLSTRDDPTISKSAADAITQAMAPAANGGLITFWSTPTGCTLQNDHAQTINTSAYHYMGAVKNGNTAANIPADPLPCRDNYVLLVTDGEANGPGDSNCSSSSCAYDRTSNPNLAGCTCRAVLAAYNLRQDLGVKTYVVGFSGDVSSGSARTTNDNIARAGGTDAGDDGVAPFAHLAQNEDQLNTALQLVIYSAVRGSYSTAPTSTSAGTQQATTVAEGRYALDSRMDFPEWKGHLLAYDLAGSSPVLAWDAYQKLVSTNWWQRLIYTWDGSRMVKIVIDPATHAVTNAANLATLGMGATPAEAESVVRWMLGDPTYRNPSALGAIVNSTPIDVASPGDLPQPGGHEFFLRYQNRPHLIYVGSSDGMLHAFFLENTNVGGTTYQAGSEAFAFLPPDMMMAVRRQYAQGGQKPDPYEHIFGLADSPKAKSMCVQNCSDAATAVWKTLLLMPEGYGGSDTFMLDVTNPFSSTGIADPPATVVWHTGYGANASTYNSVLGNTISLPAFFLNQSTGLDDYRVAFASGYPVTDGSTTQGRALITASAATGRILTTSDVGPATPCSQEYTALTDVATARDFARGQDNKLIAAYFGDTSGQLFRYILGSGVTVAQALTCSHPLHFSPTVVQLDRDSYTSAYAHDIFPVQVTNSNLDLDTETLPPSKMVIWRESVETDINGNLVVAKDPTFGNSGEITLTVGNNDEICGTPDTDSHNHVTCRTAMPAAARPTSTPLGLLLADGSGFEVMTMWYVYSDNGCTRGQTYLTVHRVTGTGGATQRFGSAVASEPVTSPVILSGRVFVFGSGGPVEITSMIPDAITPGRAGPPNGGTGKFRRFNWTEVLQ
jgi:hypothetical protein